MRYITVSIDEQTHRHRRRIRLSGTAARLRLAHKRLADTEESAEEYTIEREVTV
ncbi:MAG: hypothetical protein J4F39_01780 [Candidatus Latescibacteria bacterium]|nr:hypothetical protein [Candidatus Latescibacterota bacterium]